MKRLLNSVCELGYPQSQLEEILGDRLGEFNEWMYGQTMAICDGRKWNHKKGDFDETGCGPHGPVVYPWDLQRFIDEMPIID